MQQYKTFLYTAILCLALTSCVDQPLSKTTFPNESYGTEERNVMDVYLPNERNSHTETVVLIHGGGWVGGDKTNWDSEFINNFLSQGFAVVLMNYRYACGDFHKQMEDIDKAITHVREKAETWNISKDRFALMGGSAGGHLSLLYAHAFDSLHVVKAVISLVGPTDLADPLFHNYARNYNFSQMFQDFLGASLADSPQVYRDASPLYNRGDVPSLFIHGKKDDLVPYLQSVSMYDSLRVSGVVADIMITENAGHDVFGKDSIYYDEVLDKINLWLKQYLDK